MVAALDPTQANSPPATSDDVASDERRGAEGGGKFDLIVIGAGPAGLTAAVAAVKRGLRPLVLEADHCVGGISRTEDYKGYGFDMGGHRFFSKSREVVDLWHELLGDDFLTRPRLSRIYYNGKFYAYPLKPFDALRNLGLYESSFLIASYLRWKVFPFKDEQTFEQWVVNRFGRRLYRTFFKTYTEKVWGVSTKELRADWAAQRIKGLSFRRAVMAGLFKPNHGKITSLIERFEYPRRGPGMLWNAAVDYIQARSGEVRLNTPIKQVLRDGLQITGVVTASGERLEAERYVSTLPLKSLVHSLDPAPPAEVVEAAHSLRYRDFLTVCLIVDEPAPFPDNWVYVHDASVRVGRVQNFKNWSEEMVPEEDRKSRTSLGMEYFCNVGDDLWEMDDAEIVALATREIEKIGLLEPGKVADGVVYRVPKSYPIYDEAYADHVAAIRAFVDSFENAATIGRNGLHRYNNQDHSMLTALRAIENLYDAEAHDVWSINADQEYHEQKRSGSGNATGTEPAGRNQNRVTRPNTTEAADGDATGDEESTSEPPAKSNGSGGRLLRSRANRLMSPASR